MVDGLVCENSFSSLSEVKYFSFAHIINKVCLFKQKSVEWLFLQQRLTSFLPKVSSVLTNTFWTEVSKQKYATTWIYFSCIYAALKGNVLETDEVCININ